MSDNDDKPLTDDEYEELMFLFRVCRAGNETPEERQTLVRLMRRFNKHHASVTESPHK